jgi:cob(I)alamin adenosyltransferase
MVSQFQSLSFSAAPAMPDDREALDPTELPHTPSHELAHELAHELVYGTTTLLAEDRDRPPMETLLRRSPLPAREITRELIQPVSGQVQVFTCPHRSFFTSVMAQALRRAGQGSPVLVVQFLKGGIAQGFERPVQLGQHLDWVRCNLPKSIHATAQSEIEARSVLDLWHQTQSRVMAGRYALVVLDELSLAMSLGFIPETEVLQLLSQKPGPVDIVMTGPKMPQTLLDLADQVTEIRRNY